MNTAKSASHSHGRAIVRQPSLNIASGEITHIERIPLDVTRAITQHGDYVDLLRSLNIEVLFAANTPEHPDGVFVEDTMFMLNNHAVVARPGAPSRRKETASIVALLGTLGIPTVSIPEPHTLDGGDVLVVEHQVFIGLSTRTTHSAVEFVRAFANARGFEVFGVPVTRCLHLKTAVTRLPDNSLIAVPGFADIDLFTRCGLTVHETSETHGGDVLCIDETVVLAANASKTARLIRTIGFETQTIDISELQKVEAGVTCMSVLLPNP
jgi:dimethylargininase